ncbi:MAG: oligosaccharide flippase family protein [Verrucomicrobiota bacterium]
MSSPLKEKAFLQSGLILTAVSLISSMIHYVFQAVMGRMLPRDEFGYMNSTLGVVLLASVPLSAASQTIAHYLARLQAEGDSQKLEAFRQQSLTWLWRGTWVLIAVALVLWKPVREFLNFPRNSLSLVALVFLPAQLWSVVAAAWCAGMGRFKTLGILTLGGAITRLIGGVFMAWMMARAESGIVATLFGALTMGAILIFIPRDRSKMGSSIAFPKGFLPFLFASISVGMGCFLFLQSDQIIAQRYFSGMDLGNYSAAGVLGRAVVLGSLPFLTVYFTQRSEILSTNRQSWNLKVLYFGCLSCGVLVVLFGSDLLCKILLGQVEVQTTVWMDQFALNMLMVGILHAIGFFLLATRRLVESVFYGLSGLIYAGLLLHFGVTPDAMLLTMRRSNFCLLVFMVCIVCLITFIKKKVLRNR